MQMLSQTLGLRRLRMTLLGISKRMYGTKKMVNAVLYPLAGRWRSSVKLDFVPSAFVTATLAFAMFVRSRNASRSSCPVSASRHAAVDRAIPHTQYTQNRNDSEVNLGYEASLSRMRWAHNTELVSPIFGIAHHVPEVWVVAVVRNTTGAHRLARVVRMGLCSAESALQVQKFVEYRPVSLLDAPVLVNILTLVHDCNHNNAAAALRMRHSE